jgi:hypothetical protein
MKFAMQGAQDKGRIFHAAFAGANAGQHHRARPRRVGGVIRPQFGSRHVCCRGLKKNTAQPTTLLASSNLWMTRGKLLRIQGRVRLKMWQIARNDKNTKKMTL